MLAAVWLIMSLLCTAGRLVGNAGSGIGLPVSIAFNQREIAVYLESFSTKPVTRAADTRCYSRVILAGHHV